MGHRTRFFLEADALEPAWGSAISTGAEAKRLYHGAASAGGLRT
jgi:hypothetical protein